MENNWWHSKKFWAMIIGMIAGIVSVWEPELINAVYPTVAYIVGQSGVDAYVRGKQAGKQIGDAVKSEPK